MTVKQVFQRAYGRMPEGSKCYVGHTMSSDTEGFNSRHIYEATIKCDGPEWPMTWVDNEWSNKNCYEFVIGEDISDKPATGYKNFFDDRYKRELDWIQFLW